MLYQEKTKQLRNELVITETSTLALVTELLENNLTLTNEDVEYIEKDLDEYIDIIDECTELNYVSEETMQSTSLIVLAGHHIVWYDNGVIEDYGDNRTDAEMAYRLESMRIKARK